MPVSGGTSSLVLLEILDSQLKRQLAGRGRAAYDIHVLSIDTSEIDSTSGVTYLVDRLIKQFPSHVFSVLSLESVFDLDKTIYEALSEVGFQRQDGEDTKTALKRLLTSAATLTSRSDILEILLLRLIVAFANNDQCESVLWGHSDSRLAAKALANVAKGRGSSLPFQIGDGPSPWGPHFNYPLRDLFKSELELYASLLPDHISDLIVPEAEPGTPSSIRDTSIDDLLTKYINSQGEKYPSIMANVVRTASKLQAPSSMERAVACLMCAMPIGATGTEPPDTKLCYGCLKIRSEIKSTAAKGKT